MVIIGIGSNEGHRLSYLRQALKALKADPNIEVIATSPVYQSDALMPPGAPKHWNRPYLNAAIQVRYAANPDELVVRLKAIEARIGRQDQAHWAPRVIDMDLLCFDDQVIQSQALTLPHAGLLSRPFALWPLLDLAPHWLHPEHPQAVPQCLASWGSRWSGTDAPFRTRRVWQRIDTPALMGIMNLTPDSFSDGNPNLRIESQLKKADQLVVDGAAILDLGAESTRPGATPISAEEEWQRLSPLLQALRTHTWADPALKPLISIDTYHLETMHRALDWGADWINDVSGALCKHAHLSPKTQWVCMRPRSAPITHTGRMAAEQCLQWMAHQSKQLGDQGIDLQQIIMDPGIGFGCPPEVARGLLLHADLFQSLGLRILIGHSRKSFLSGDAPMPAEQRDIATLAWSMRCQPHVDVLRLHQVRHHSEYWASQHHMDQVKQHWSSHHAHLAT